MKILVAMSGGVDSSVAAGLLRDQGHDVVGATLKLWGGTSDSGCCSVADVDDARRVAQVLGLDHHVFNYTEEFERDVVEPFVRGHAEGRTPNPCIECNRHIKFDLLFERAQRLGFDAVATGHHARVATRDGHYFLERSADVKKDQSYVLGYLKESTLARLLLPIGAMTKEEVRAHAEHLGLRTWDKPDSQDVCFIEASKGRESFLQQRIRLTPAAVHDRSTGELLGTVPAAELMTVGQRRGVAPGVDGEKRFVASVDLARRRVEVDRLNDIMISELTLDTPSVTFARATPTSDARLWVQRSAHGEPTMATVRPGAAWKVCFDVPVRPVAAGQTVVFYSATTPSVVEGAALVGGA